VYPLLHAEFALRHNDLPRALELLHQEMAVLAAPAVARRTLQLAEYLKDEVIALEAAQRLTVLDPSDAAAAATAMGLLVRAGDNTRALEYARMAKNRGGRINAPILLADFEQLSPKEQQQIRDGLTALQDEYPDDHDIAIAMALLQRGLGQYAAALEPLERVLAADRYNERALVLWTQTQLAIDSQNDNAFKRIRNAVDANPGDEQLRLQYARLLGSAERFEAARTEFKRLIETSPRNDEYLLAAALLEFELGQFLDAKTYLTQLIDNGQRVDDAHYYLGVTSEKMAQPEDAVRYFSLVGPSRHFIDAKRRGAEILLQQNDLISFERFFIKARRQWREQQNAIFLMQAELLGRAGAHSSAVAVLNEALKENPDDIALLYARALQHEQQDQFGAMEQDFQAILTLDPDNATTLNAFGYSLTNHTTRFEEALVLIDRANSLVPNDPAIMDSLGWVYFKLGRYTEARQLLEEAYSLFPDQEIAAHLGEVLWQQGQQGDALAIWSEALERNPRSPAVRAVMERLNASFP
jgi:tetratricopeptide (TPR) repeat protein